MAVTERTAALELMPLITVKTVAGTNSRNTHTKRLNLPDE